jgi:hypothetical protein
MATATDEAAGKASPVDRHINNAKDGELDRSRVVQYCTSTSCRLTSPEEIGWAGKVMLV